MTEEQYMEALGILQEECAEVIQAVSKIRRSGKEYKPFKGEKANWVLLKEEIQDVLVILEYLNHGETVEVDTQHRRTKIEKLRKWSGLYTHRCEGCASTTANFSVEKIEYTDDNVLQKWCKCSVCSKMQWIDTKIYN